MVEKFVCPKLKQKKKGIRPSGDPFDIFRKLVLIFDINVEETDYLKVLFTGVLREISPVNVGQKRYILSKSVYSFLLNGWMNAIYVFRIQSKIYDGVFCEKSNF